MLSTSYQTVGYHGTSTQNAQAILNDGFKASKGNAHYLGDGVYFYENSPEMAYEWCRGDGLLKKKYAYYAILRCELMANKVLDLRCSAARARFHSFRSSLRDAVSKSYFSIRTNRLHYDGHVLNALCKVEEYDAIVKETFSASQEDRYLSLRSHVPNGTEICIKDAKSCIISTEIYEEGNLNAKREKGVPELF